jgi:hypothetical protein
MSNEHNHEPRCCCSQTRYEPCPACPQHGAFAIPAAEALCGFRNLLIDDMPICTYPPHPITERHSWQPATPYTEQETTNG